MTKLLFLNHMKTYQLGLLSMLFCTGLSSMDDSATNPEPENVQQEVTRGQMPHDETYYFIFSNFQQQSMSASSSSSSSNQVIYLGMPVEVQALGYTANPMAYHFVQTTTTPQQSQGTQQSEQPNQIYFAKTPFGPMGSHSNRLTIEEKEAILKKVYLISGGNPDLDRNDNVTYNGEILSRFNVFYKKLEDSKLCENIFLPRQSKIGPIIGGNEYKLNYNFEADKWDIVRSNGIAILFNDIISQVDFIYDARKVIYQKLRKYKEKILEEKGIITTMVDNEALNKHRKVLEREFIERSKKRGLNMEESFNKLQELIGAQLKNPSSKLSQTQITCGDNLHGRFSSWFSDFINLMINPNDDVHPYLPSDMYDSLKAFEKNGGFIFEQLNDTLRLPGTVDEFELNNLKFPKFDFISKEENDLVRQMFLIFNQKKRNELSKKERDSLRHAIELEVENYPSFLSNHSNDDRAIQKANRSCTEFDQYILIARHLFRIEALLPTAESHERPILISARQVVLEKLATLDPEISAPLLEYAEQMDWN